MSHSEDGGMEDIEITSERKVLTDVEIQRLQLQEDRKVSEFKSETLEKDAKKYWDLFYKRNENRFFKDRHWTTREFKELLHCQNDFRKVLFEIGCGTGNFIFPLVEENLNFDIVACDLSPRAVELLRSNRSFDPNRIKVFQCDITTEEVFDQVMPYSVDITTLIFVLSAIHPNKFVPTLSRVFRVLKPGGLLLFRDYGLYDMAQLRFKAGNKIDENFYMRQDGTRSYYFSTEFMDKALREAGFEVLVNTYIHRRTINKKEEIDVPRIFVQCKARKPD